MLHIHWDTSSSDCDGPIDRYRVSAPAGWGDTLDKVLRTVVASFYHPCQEWDGTPLLGAWCDEYEHSRTLKIRPVVEPVEPTDESDDPWPQVTVTGWIIETSAPHEEGGSYERIQVCEDEGCEVGTSGQRDYYAESMGF